MPTVKVNDIQMYYEIHGEGKPLLLIGGLGRPIGVAEHERLARATIPGYRFR